MFLASVLPTSAAMAKDQCEFDYVADVFRDAGWSEPGQDSYGRSLRRWAKRADPDHRFVLTDDDDSYVITIGWTRNPLEVSVLTKTLFRKWYSHDIKEARALIKSLGPSDVLDVRMKDEPESFGLITFMKVDGLDYAIEIVAIFATARCSVYIVRQGPSIREDFDGWKRGSEAIHEVRDVILDREGPIVFAATEPSLFSIILAVDDPSFWHKALGAVVVLAGISAVIYGLART